MSVAYADVTLEFDGDEMNACSQVLRLASPVFDGMLASAMEEARNKRIKVDIVSKPVFATFYKLTLPGKWSPSEVTKANVDRLLVLSDYYQVEFLKSVCEDLLIALPATVSLLLQARKHGLSKQYARCVREVAHDDSLEELKPLEATPEVLMDVAVVMRQHMRQHMKRGSGGAAAQLTVATLMPLHW